MQWCRLLKPLTLRPYFYGNETIKTFVHYPSNNFRTYKARFCTNATDVLQREDKLPVSNRRRPRMRNNNRSTDEEGNNKPLNLFKPLVVKPDIELQNFGEELTGKLDKKQTLSCLIKFSSDKEIKALAKDHGLEGYLYNQAETSFRRFCLDAKHLPTELHVLLSDILKEVTHYHDLFPYFLSHAKKVFPHLDCIDELKLISDLTDPSNWYPEARDQPRKIVFHAGPTNSGKTYHALERFMSAKSGIYCGPLKLLAVEVNNKCKARGVPCDLITGEERKLCSEDGEPSAHIACTVEMSNLAQHYEVAVIDEIQVIKDYQRGWAWTRALLGIQADEIHVCGEAAAINLVSEIMINVGEIVEVRKYERLTKLIIEDSGLGSIKNTQPGDCIVCFSKQDIYSISRALENLGKEVAVIYGSLPPNTKLAMANKFNDPNDSCKILVATDAIGMGLNLNIRRVIFNTVTKIQLTEDGNKENDLISVSQALQIAGRAGRYGTKWDTGYVTTFKHEDLDTLKGLLAQTPDPILQAGLHPTFDQLEMYAYHLPSATLSNLVDIFVSLSTVDDSLYTLCHLDDFKYLADMIEHITLPLKAKYVFCCAPINRRFPFVSTMFVKIVRQFSKGNLITFDWLCTQIGWPLSHPHTILDLIHLEAVHDVFDIYLWLSYRFSDMFPDVRIVQDVQDELDSIIENGVFNIVELLKNKDNDIRTHIKTNVENGFDKEQLLNIPTKNDDFPVLEASSTSTVQPVQEKEITSSSKQVYNIVEGLLESEGKNAVQMLYELNPGAKFGDVSRQGPEHSPVFYVEAYIHNLTGIGYGSSKKEAKMNASKDLMFNLHQTLPEEEYTPKVMKKKIKMVLNDEKV